VSKFFNDLRAENSPDTTDYWGNPLAEGIETRGNIRDLVNKCSSAWWDDYESNGRSGWFANGKGLIPLTNFRIDAKRKNGIMIMGINGAVGNEEITWWKDVLDKYDNADEDGKLLIRQSYEGIYGGLGHGGKKGQKRRLQKTDKSYDDFGGKYDSPDPESSMRGTDWGVPSKKRPSDTSKHGMFPFQSNFNRLLEVWDEKELIKKCGNSNFVPWGSHDIKYLKPEHFKLSAPVASEILKFFQPKLVCMPLENKKHITKFGFKIKEHAIRKEPLTSAAGKTKTYRIFEIHELKGPGFETVLWFMPHWTTQGGALQIKAWKESIQFRQDCKDLIRRLIGIQTAKRQIKGLG